MVALVLFSHNPPITFTIKNIKFKELEIPLSRYVELRNSPIPLTPKNGVRKRIKRNHYDEENL